MLLTLTTSQAELLISTIDLAKSAVVYQSVQSALSGHAHDSGDVMKRLHHLRVLLKSAPPDETEEPPCLTPMGWR